MFSVNMTSVIVVTSGFLQLLQKSTQKPRVINVSSGLGSIANTLGGPPISRYPPYGASKIGLNGITAHLQAMENERVAKEGKGDPIRFFSVVPGLLKTSFNNFLEGGLDPKQGAEAIVQLIADDKGTHSGGSQLQHKDGEMMNVPW